MVSMVPSLVVAPLSKGAVDAACPKPARQAGAEVEQCKSILVVEDDEGIRETMRIFLEIEGYNVVTAADGQKALDALAKANPCLILLDLMMPVMNGWEFVEALKNTKYADNPVVIVTAFTDQVGAIKHNGIIGKPFDLAALKKTVQRWCGEPGGTKT